MKNYTKVFVPMAWAVILKLAMLSSYAQTSVNVSSSENALLSKLRFDKAILTDAKAATGSNAEQFYLAGKVKIEKGHQVETNKIYYQGLLFRVTRDKAEQVISKLNDRFYAKGYIICKSEGNLRNDLWKIGIFKTTDPFEVLKIMGTNASSDAHDNAWVIAYAKSIYEKYPYRLTGADIDWLEAQFITPPSDWEQFARELYKNCPDIFENDEESISDVAQKMKKTNRLYLLWE